MRLGTLRFGALWRMSCGFGVLVLSNCDMSSPEVVGPASRASAPHTASHPAAQDNKRSSPNLELVGLDEAQVTKLLGPPSESRDEAPGKWLSYRRKSCRLNLSLYPDVETRKFRTLSYEVISDDDTNQGKSYCRSSFGAVLGAQ
jgi:hypothetical protein